MGRGRGGAWRAPIIGAALACAALAGGPAAARGIGDELRKLVADGPKADERQLGRLVPDQAREGPVTLDQAVARVRARHPKAEVVGAQTRETERGTLHVIKLLKPDGKLKVIRIDAATGAPVG